MILYILFILGALMLFDFTMGSGQILGKYGDWLESKCDKWWPKFLGGCILCVGFWLSAGMAGTLFYLGKLGITEALAFPFIVHILLRIVNRLNI